MLLASGWPASRRRAAVSRPERLSNKGDQLARHQSPDGQSANATGGAVVLPPAVSVVPVSGELVEPRTAWLPEEARELFTARSRLLARDPYLLHAPANTQRARRADWSLFCTFCEGMRRPAMPASPETVVAFLEAVRSSPPLRGGRPRQEHVRAESLTRRAQRERSRSATRFPGRPRTTARAAKTLDRYLTTIGTAHRLAEEADPTRVARVRNAGRALMTTLRAPKPRAPLRRAQVLDLMAGLWPAQPIPSGAARATQAASEEGRATPQRGWVGATPAAARLWDLRARAVLACLYPTMARRSELAELQYEELPQTKGSGVVPIHSQKTQQHEHRYLDALALHSVTAWCKAAGITSGPIFRALDWTGRVGETAMSGQQLLQIVRACWAHRAFQSESDGTLASEGGLSMAQMPDLGAHSTRIGAAHDLVASGQDLLAIMHSGGWKDPRMPRKYIQELKAEDSGMARMLRARKRRSPSPQSTVRRRSHKRKGYKSNSPGKGRPSGTSR